MAGPDPRPRGPGATLLLNSRNGVLSFDSDGGGSISDEVIVTLPGFKTVRSHWLIIRPRR